MVEIVLEENLKKESKDVWTCKADELLPKVSATEYCNKDVYRTAYRINYCDDIDLRRCFTMKFLILGLMSPPNIFGI